MFIFDTQYFSIFVIGTKLTNKQKILKKKKTPQKGSNMFIPKIPYKLAMFCNFCIFTFVLAFQFVAM